MNRAPAALVALGVLLLFVWLAWPVTVLQVGVEGVGPLFFAVRKGTAVELDWVHSVSAIPVREVFRVADGALWLEETHNPWFAAGLGEIAGRGRTVAEAGHAVAIVDIHESAEGMALRIGSPEIHHTLVVGGRRCDLSRLAPHARAVFEVVTLPRVYTLRGVRCE